MWLLIWMILTKAKVLYTRKTLQCVHACKMDRPFLLLLTQNVISRKAKWEYIRRDRKYFCVGGALWPCFTSYSFFILTLLLCDFLQRKVLCLTSCEALWPVYFEYARQYVETKGQAMRNPKLVDGNVGNILKLHASVSLIFWCYSHTVDHCWLTNKQLLVCCFRTYTYCLAVYWLFPCFILLRYTWQHNSSLSCGYFIGSSDTGNLKKSNPSHSG